MNLPHIITEWYNAYKYFSSNDLRYIKLIQLNIIVSKFNNDFKYFAKVFWTERTIYTLDISGGKTYILMLN